MATPRSPSPPPQTQQQRVTTAELEVGRLSLEVAALHHELTERTALLRASHTTIHDMQSRLMAAERERDSNVDFARQELVHLRGEVVLSLQTIAKLTADREMLSSELLVLKRTQSSDRYKAKYMELKRRLMVIGGVAEESSKRVGEIRSRSMPATRPPAAPCLKK